MKYDFSGWATKNDIKCSDGRIIRKDAFRDCDGQIVPLVWNHDHDSPLNVLGHALLENRAEGVYAYCSFNDTEAGAAAKEVVKHGDVVGLSIYANKLTQRASSAAKEVLHGTIRELSLVLARANPGAFIDTVMVHGEGSDETEEAIIYSGVLLTDEEINHADSSPKKKEVEDEDDDPDDKDADDDIDDEEDDDEEEKDVKDKEKLQHAEEGDKERTVQDVYDEMTDEQKTVVQALVGAAVEEAKGKDGDEEDDKGMKHNAFEQGTVNETEFLSHADQENIIELAKDVGSFNKALKIYAEENDMEISLQHGFSDPTQLFPEYQLIKPGAPEMITRDQSWVSSVINKAHKSPIPRVRMRQADIRPETIRGLGYTKAEEKQLIGSIELLGRTFDPQTVYVKDKIDRDDILDITDFDVVEYQRSVMRIALNETIALAALIGDGKVDGADGKIKEAHIHSIWNDDELYTIHADVDFNKAKAELQGSNTNANFGENYIYAEAIITAALYAREKYKGSGALDFYCTPHLLNIMLLARDLNGRRIYDSKSDLAAALNVGEIHTVEQFEGKTRKTSDNKVKKLLGIFVNMADYQFGSAKGGEITSFDDFDIDFNQYKYLMETRLSGGLTKVFSAIALEEDVTPVGP